MFTTALQEHGGNTAIETPEKIAQSQNACNGLLGNSDCASKNGTGLELQESPPEANAEVVAEPLALSQPFCGAGAGFLPQPNSSGASFVIETEKDDVEPSQDNTASIFGSADDF